MNHNQLTVASLNVQGLGKDHNGIRKRREMKDLFQRATPRPNILLIQKHKFSRDECLEKTKQLDFTNGTSLWNEATNAAAQDSFQGGTGIITNQQLSNKICEHGVIIPGRAQFLTIQCTTEIKVGIINIYAVNHIGSRA